MSPEPEDRIISGASGEGNRRKADASVVLNQLRGIKTPENEETTSADKIDKRDEISSDQPVKVVPSAVMSSRDEVPLNTDEIRRKLNNEDADRKIREQLASAQKWEEKQKIIAHERDVQKKRLNERLKLTIGKNCFEKWKRTQLW